MQSINNKKHLLEQVLHDNNYDIACLSETFLTEEKLESLNIEGYDIGAYFCRKKHNKGGVGILVKDNIQFIERSDIADTSIEFVIEYCAIEIEYLNLLIICIYWNERETETFLKSFNSLLSKLKREQHKNIILGGDFNINMLENTKFTSDFRSLMLSFNYTLQVKSPTRVCTTTSTCIDLVFTNFRHTKTYEQELGLSDHHGVIVDTNIEPLQNTQKQIKIKKRLFTHKQIILLKQHLKSRYRLEKPAL